MTSPLTARIERFEDLASEHQDIADELSDLAQSEPASSLWEALSNSFAALS